MGQLYNGGPEGTVMNRSVLYPSHRMQRVTLCRSCSNCGGGGQWVSLPFLPGNIHPLSGSRQWQPTPVLLPGRSHGQRSLVGCSPWCHEESDTTERLHFHFSLSCTGEGNGNPLQCSCLESHRDRGAWWAAVCGVAQSWTWLTQLSSSNSSSSSNPHALGTCVIYKQK